MDWIVFSYSLPAKAGSTPRVALWRRLRRLGAISPTGSLYILPSTEETQESFQWLAQEVQQAGGEALVMHSQHFEGLADGQIVDLFNRAVGEAYEEIGARLSELEVAATAAQEPADLAGLRDSLARVRRQLAEVTRIDYFHAPAGATIAAHLNRVEQALAPGAAGESEVPPAVLADFRGRQWVTRPRPHVDRLACIWLIRRFVDGAATIRFAAEATGDEIAFDMAGATFGHRGNLCSYETMLQAFGLTEAGLQPLAEIVHEIDLRDGRFGRPETAGVEAVLEGWRRMDLADSLLAEQGLALFDGLYHSFSTAPAA